MNGLEYILGYFDKHKVTSSLHKQIILFIVSGGICYIVDISILVFLVEILNINIILSNCISVLISIYVTYLLNVKFVFQNGKFGMKKEITLFLIFSGISFLWDILLLYLLVKYTAIWYVWAKIIVTSIVALFNFSTSKLFIFSK